MAAEVGDRVVVDHEVDDVGHQDCRVRLRAAGIDRAQRRGPVGARTAEQREKRGREQHGVADVVIGDEEILDRDDLEHLDEAEEPDRSDSAQTHLIDTIAAARR
jgi:hypothetical protein